MEYMLKLYGHYAASIAAVFWGKANGNSATEIVVSYEEFEEKVKLEPEVGTLYEVLESMVSRGLLEYYDDEPTEGGLW